MRVFIAHQHYCQQEFKCFIYDVVKRLRNDSKEEIIQDFYNKPKSVPVQQACESLINDDIFTLLEKDSAVATTFASYWDILHDSNDFVL